MGTDYIDYETFNRDIESKSDHALRVLWQSTSGLGFIKTGCVRKLLSQMSLERIARAFNYGNTVFTQDEIQMVKDTVDSVSALLAERYEKGDHQSIRYALGLLFAAYLNDHDIGSGLVSGVRNNFSSVDLYNEAVRKCHKAVWPFVNRGYIHQISIRDCDNITTQSVLMGMFFGDDSPETTAEYLALCADDDNDINIGRTGNISDGTRFEFVKDIKNIIHRPAKEYAWKLPLLSMGALEHLHSIAMSKEENMWMLYLIYDALKERKELVGVSSGEAAVLE